MQINRSQILFHFNARVFSIRKICNCSSFRCSWCYSFQWFFHQFVIWRLKLHTDLWTLILKILLFRKYRMVDHLSLQLIHWVLFVVDHESNETFHLNFQNKYLLYQSLIPYLDRTTYENIVVLLYELDYIVADSGSGTYMSPPK